MLGIPKGYENLVQCLLGDMVKQLPWWRRMLMRVWPPYRRKMVLALLTENPNGAHYPGSYGEFPLIPNDTWRN